MCREDCSAKEAETSPSPRLAEIRIRQVDNGYIADMYTEKGHKTFVGVSYSAILEQLGSWAWYLES